MASYKHPEVLTGEVFVGNAWHEDGLSGFGWNTARLGNISYTADGLKVLDDHRPVFIMRSEIDGRIKPDATTLAIDDATQSFKHG